MSDEKWKCKDGREIMVSEMTEAHAKNCLNLTLRRIREAKERTGYGPIIDTTDWSDPHGCDNYGSLE